MTASSSAETLTDNTLTAPPSPTNLALRKAFSSQVQVLSPSQQQVHRQLQSPLPSRGQEEQQLNQDTIIATTVPSTGHESTKIEQFSYNRRTLDRNDSSDTEIKVITY